MKQPPKCYKCRWRGNVAGSTHSKCLHPFNNAIHDPMMALLATFASVGRGKMPPLPGEKLNIKANETGVRNGWFQHPFNFDPIWLESCDGFEKFRENDARIRTTSGKANNILRTCEQPYFCEDCPKRFDCFTER